MDRPAPGRNDASILHVDMDAFFAAVEVLHDPSLAGRPVVVGGTGGRGVVASCTYEARAYGVRSAMPSAHARRLCPSAIFVPGRYDLYAEYSRRLHAVLAGFTPLVEGIGLDEAFLDVNGGRRLLGTGEEIGWAIRARVHSELGLWSSVGVATSKLIAKLASEAAKPRAVARPSPASPSPVTVVPGAGVTVVEPGTELSFLHPLPVRSLWGVGPATYRRLERFGVQTVGDLAGVPEEALTGALGQALGRHLHQLAWGVDNRAVQPDRAPKSIGHEETYASDHHHQDSLQREVLRLSDAVAGRLRGHGLAARTVTIKVRFGDFRTITRSRTVPEALHTGPAVAGVAGELLAAVDVSPGVRLLGVSCSSLSEQAPVQLTLEAEGPGEQGGGDERRWEGVTQAIDDVRRRFGERSVGPAALIGGTGLDVKRRGDQRWGPGT